ncbi:MAG: yvrE [Paucimonas sp.]|nr:yvrE [Paucimonas sp.]
MSLLQPFHTRPMLLGECPLWEPRANALYWIDIEDKSVHRQQAPGGQHMIWRLPSEPGCIARAECGLVVAMRSGIALLDTERGQLEHLADPPFDPALQRFNDGKCDVAGRLWAGTIHEPRDGPRASLYRFADGRMRDMALPVTVSNGLAFAPDWRTMYHADTTAHCIWTYQFDLASGELGTKRLLRRFDPTRGAAYGGRPDGAAVDAEGAYWIAMYDGGRLLRLAPDGEILREVLLPVRCPTMIAFGGADLKTLFITSVSHKRADSELAAHPLSGMVLQMQVDVPGRIEPMFQSHFLGGL